MQCTGRQRALRTAIVAVELLLGLVFVWFLFPGNR